MSTQLAVADNRKTSYSYVRDGVEGNFEVAFQAVRLTRQAAFYDREFQRFVNAFLVHENLNGYAPAERKFRAIYNFVTSNIFYATDPAGRIESIKSPARTLSDGYGDCDDLSILIAAMLGVAGFEPRFVLANYGNSASQFEHIYVDVKTPDGQRFVFDPSLPKPQFNFEVRPKTVATINIFKDDPTVNGVYGIFRQLALTGKEIFKKSADAAHFFSNFLPLPASLGVSTGLNMITSVSTQNHSLSEIGADIHEDLDRLIAQLQRNEIPFDVAKHSALQIASRLNVRSWNDDQKETYQIIYKTIKQKLDFINDYTKSNPCIKLNSKGMLLFGAGLLGVAAYFYFNNR